MHIQTYTKETKLTEILGSISTLIIEYFKNNNLKPQLQTVAELLTDVLKKLENVNLKYYLHFVNQNIGKFVNNKI